MAAETVEVGGARSLCLPPLALHAMAQSLRALPNVAVFAAPVRLIGSLPVLPPASLPHRHQ